MKTRALIAVGAAVVGALGFVASGCGGSETDTAPTNITQTAAAPEKPSAEDAAILHDAQETLKFVRKADSETPGATNSAGLAKWGELVTGVEVADGALTVKTSIFPDGDVKANQYDTRICNGFAAMINVPTRVLDSQGGEMGSCSRHRSAPDRYSRREVVQMGLLGDKDERAAKRSARRDKAEARLDDEVGKEIERALEALGHRRGGLILQIANESRGLAGSMKNDAIEKHAQALFYVNQAIASLETPR